MGKRNYIDEARLQMPDLPSDYVPRVALFSSLGANAKKPLTLVCAGAGFGKSTLISGWLRQVPHQSVWISVQEEHNDLRAFLSLLVEAVRQEFPMLGKTMLPLLQISPLPPVNYLAVELKNELGKLPNPFFLVLDDLHLVKNPSTFKLLQTLLDPPLKKLHLYIISRKTPPLSLSKLRMKGGVNEIGPQQLRMAPEEMDAFLSSNQTKQIDSSIRSLVQERSEGWMAGLRLFKLQLSSDFEGFRMLVEAGRTDQVFDTYFLEEILGHCNEEHLDTLRKISILSHFHPDLADALTDCPKGLKGREIIDYLLAENLFIIVLDRGNEWYRFHHLFHTLLRKELEKTVPPKMQRQLHERAARWYGKNGMVEEALSHAKKAGEHDWAARLLADQFFRVLEQDQDHLLENWLSQIPERFIQKSPMLQIVRMWVLKDREAFHLLPELLESLLQRSSDLDGELQAYALFFQGIVQFWGGLLEPSAQSFKKTLNLLSPPKHTGILGETQVYYATAMQMLGKGNKVVDEIEKRLLCENLPPNYQLKLVGALLFQTMFAGKLKEGLHLVNRLKRISAGANNPFIETWANYILGNIHLRQNRLERAKDAFSSALQRRYIMDLVSPADCFASQLLTLQAKGDTEEFQSVLQDFQKFIWEQNNPLFRMWFYSIQARLALRQKELPRAERLFQQVELSDDTHNFLFWIEDPRVTHCRLLLARNTVQSLEEAGGLLQKLLHHAQETHHVLLTIELRILSAIQEKKRDCEPKAVAHLEAAIQLAAPGDLFYLFVEVGDELEPLLPKTALKFQSLEFFGELLERIHPARLPQVSGKLTNREMDVLTLFEQRLTNQEVADELCISVATIKRHAISIYRKLDAKNRRDAVLKAVQEGILVLK